MAFTLLNSRSLLLSSRLPRAQTEKELQFCHCSLEIDAARLLSHDILFSLHEVFMEGLSVIGYVFRMMGIAALVRVEKLIKTLKGKGILEQNYKEE